MDTHNKKVIFVPGWMHTLNFYNKKEGLDIWIKDEEYAKKVEAEIAIGHSLGANFILAHHSEEIEKIILVNPVLRKSFREALGAWIKHIFIDKTNTDSSSMLLYFFSSLRKARELFKFDYEKILATISPEKVFVLRGREDRYLCSEKSLAIFRKYGIKIIEIDGVDHNWGEIYDQETERIANS